MTMLCNDDESNDDVDYYWPMLISPNNFASKKNYFSFKHLANRKHSDLQIGKCIHIQMSV